MSVEMACVPFAVTVAVIFVIISLVMAVAVIFLTVVMITAGTAVFTTAIIVTAALLITMLLAAADVSVRPSFSRKILLLLCALCFQAFLIGNHTSLLYQLSNCSYVYDPRVTHPILFVKSGPDFFPACLFASRSF